MARFIRSGASANASAGYLPPPPPNPPQDMTPVTFDSAGVKIDDAMKSGLVALAKERDLQRAQGDVPQTEWFGLLDRA